tara:strand:- start:190 stop:360 length:171 start_codon:yes stop_codon:yes gene_type:complete
MEIFKYGGRTAKLASSDWFTGTVWQEPIVEAPGPSRVRALSVYLSQVRGQLGTLTL